MSKSWWVIAFLAIALLVSAGASVASASSKKASASTYVWNNSGSYVTVWTGPDFNCGGLCGSKDLRNGTHVTMWCWADFYPVFYGNYASPRWFVIKLSTGKRWWIHSSYIPTNVQTKVGHC